MDEEIIGLGEKLWNFHHVYHGMRQVEWMIVLGSIDVDVAIYAAELVASGWAKNVIITGGIAHDDDLLRTAWHGTSEAEKFAELMSEKGVDTSCILLETQATNTGENAIFTKKLFADKGNAIDSAIVVTKPYMERRALATFAKQWPELDTILTSRPVTFEAYLRENDSDTILNLMVGDLQRIVVYAEKHYQIPQEIPDDVWEAYESLISKGFDKHLLR